MRDSHSVGRVFTTVLFMLSLALSAVAQWTPMNPVVYDAAALIIMAAGKQAIFPGLNDYEVHESEAREQVRKVNAAMKIITDATPESGSYLNEADYFQKNWHNEFWGENYPRLLKIKQKYDPDGLFKCHHSVGS